MHGWTLKAASLIIAWSTYAFAYLALHPWLDFTTLKLVLIPVALSGWIAGPIAGMLAGTLALPVDQLLLELLLPGTLATAPAVTPETVSAAVLALATGGVAGYLHHTRSKLASYPLVTQRANHDALTGLLNRPSFEARVTKLIEEAKDIGGALALLFVDLDRFKFVNDTFGHEVGDEVLKRVARLLKETVRQNDVVARLGGDEFVLAVRGLKDKHSAGTIAAKIIRQLSSPFYVQSKTISIGASIGISLCPEDGSDIRTLTKNADNAMYRVKGGGKNWYAFSNQELRENESWRLRLERHLRSALENNELSVVYQPIVDLQSAEIVGYEALIRWSNPQVGHVSPRDFIPLAEEVGLILPINRWVLREACRQTLSWRNAGYRDIRVAVNISAQLFMQPDFPNQVQKALTDFYLPAEALELEITESVLLRDPQQAIDTLGALLEIGVQTSLDDFGTGYSSLAYLQQLPISKIKLDRSFVSDVMALGKSANSSAMITEAICALAEKLQMPVVAEGIETAKQKQFLRKLDCPFGQGFLFYRPMTPRQIERLLARAEPHKPARTRQQVEA